MPMDKTLQEQRYCAFLRGVNVKGTNMKMGEVCSVFERSGVQDVSSVLASGNILFSSGKSRATLKAQLEESMSSHFNYDAHLFLLSAQEVEVVVQQNPFDRTPDFHVYVFVGNPGIEDMLITAYTATTAVEGEEVRKVGNRCYWKVPKGSTLHSEFGKILGRKDLKSAFTSRNLNTFERLLKKLPL